MSVLIAGNTAVDLHQSVATLEDVFDKGFTRSNVMFTDEPPKVVLGGNGAATAYALGRLGVPVFLNSAIGTDGLGDLVADWLGTAGVHFVSDRVDATAVHVLRSRISDGARSSTFFPGRSIDWSVGTEGFQSGWFFASGYGGVDASTFPDLAAVIEMLGSHRNRIVLDPGPWFAQSIDRDVFRSVAHTISCLTGTLEELGTWSGGETADAVIDDYLTLGVEQVIIKLGRDGARYGASDGTRGSVAAEPVDGAHAVGAGDTFNGVLLAGFYEGLDLDANVHRAVTLATEAVRSGRGVLGAFE